MVFSKQENLLNFAGYTNEQTKVAENKLSMKTCKRNININPIDIIYPL